MCSAVRGAQCSHLLLFYNPRSPNAGRWTDEGKLMRPKCVNTRPSVVVTRIGTNVMRIAIGFKGCEC
jgi:hypothetical protein